MHHGKSVALVLIADYQNTNYDCVFYGNEYLPHLIIDNFRSYFSIIPESDLPSRVRLKAGDTLRLSLKFSFQNHDHKQDLEGNPEYPSRVGYILFHRDHAIEMITTDMILNNAMIGNNKPYPLKIAAPATPGEYEFYFSVNTGWLPPGVNSKRVKLVVE